MISTSAVRRVLAAAAIAADGVTILMATHEMGFARQVSDQVCFLDGGRMLESGPPDQVLGDPVQKRTRQFLAG
jgi:polar amino acid transport system ATP-binding protein